MSYRNYVTCDMNCDVNKRTTRCTWLTRPIDVCYGAVCQRLVFTSGVVLVSNAAKCIYCLPPKYRQHTTVTWKRGSAMQSQLRAATRTSSFNNAGWSRTSAHLFRPRHACLVVSCCPSCPCKYMTSLPRFHGSCSPTVESTHSWVLTGGGMALNRHHTAE